MANYFYPDTGENSYAITLQNLFILNNKDILGFAVL